MGHCFVFIFKNTNFKWIGLLGFLPIFNFKSATFGLNFTIMKLILRLLITAAVAFFLAKYLNIGVHISDFTSALIFAIILGILNTFLKPVLKFIGLPLTIITLGFFALVINTAVILLSAKLVSGIQFDGFWWAMLFGIILSFLTSLLNGIFLSDED